MTQPNNNSLGHAQPHVSDRNRADGTRELTLLKDGQRYVFTCAPGDETSLLAQLRAMASDPESSFTWIDAALLSHQVGIHLRQQLQQWNRE